MPAGWQKAFGELGKMFSKYPAHHLKHQETLTLVSHDTTRWFVWLSVWSPATSFLRAAVYQPLQIQWVMGFMEQCWRALGASWLLLLGFFIRVMTVLIVEMFGKHDLFWIDSCLGTAGISIFIQIKKLRHISQESRKHVFKPKCFTFWITWL